MAGIWYRAGTISVTNGSKKITGFGTLWKTSVLKPDKGHAFHGADGRIYELDYVESDTVLYLVTAYLGPTATGQAYAIDVTRTSTIPALSREISAFSAYAQGQYDSWQKVLTGTGMVTLTAPDGQQIQVPALSAMQPTSGSLKALQALTPSADQLGYFTAANAAALTPLTSFMRTLLDDDTASKALGTLGALASSSYKPRADSLNNSGGAISLFTGDCNTMKAGDFRLVDTVPALNAPALGTQYCYMETKSIYSTGALLQVAWSYDGAGALWFRNYSQNGSVWTAWRKCFDSGNILGSVGMSGGVPVGGIVESGENANGMYIKFAGGLMICFCKIDVSGVAITSAGGSIFQNSVAIRVNYPATFIGVVRSFSEALYSGGGNRPWSVLVTQGTTYSDYVLQAGTSMSSFSGSILVGVVGRWYYP